MGKNIIFVLLDCARCDRLDESSDFRKLKKLGCLFDNIISIIILYLPTEFEQ